MAKKRIEQRFVRVDGLSAWDLLRVIADSEPKAMLVVLGHQEMALLPCDGGPWVIRKGVAVLA